MNRELFLIPIFVIVGLMYFCWIPFIISNKIETKYNLSDDYYPITTTIWVCINSLGAYLLYPIFVQ